MKIKFGLYAFSLVALIAGGFGSFAMPKLELHLRRLDLKENVQFTVGLLNQKANFSKLGALDGLKVDADLAPYKVERISDAFISSDGQYIITFAKDFENNIKRIIFHFHDGKTISYADDVIDIESDMIKTSKGSIKLGDVSSAQ